MSDVQTDMQRPVRKTCPAAEPETNGRLRTRQLPAANGMLLRDSGPGLSPFMPGSPLSRP